ncbi:hypothetical protein [Streptomyces sp. YIM S03343]
MTTRRHSSGHGTARATSAAGEASPRSGRFRRAVDAVDEPPSPADRSSRTE